MNKKNIIALSCMAFIGLTIGNNISVASEQTDTYVRYHEAIRVAEICRKDNRNLGITKYDPASWSKMASYIDKKINNALGAGERLTLIEQAKSDAWKLVERKGCSSEEAMALLSVYDKELANL